MTDATTPAAPEVTAVLAAEHAWTDAHLRNDLATLERMMAAEYVRIESDGSVSDKATTLAKYTPDTRYWEIAQGDEYDVRIYGDVAVVVGRWQARGMNNGVHFDYAARFLSVYVRRDGQWLMTAEQSTEIIA